TYCDSSSCVRISALVYVCTVELFGFKFSALLSLDKPIADTGTPVRKRLIVSSIDIILNFFAFFMLLPHIKFYFFLNPHKNLKQKIYYISTFESPSFFLSYLS